MKNSKARQTKSISELLPEYNLSKLKGRVRGKYTKRYKLGTNLILLSPDVAAHFPDDRSVNAALHRLLRAHKKPIRRTR